MTTVDFSALRLRELLHDAQLELASVVRDAIYPHDALSELIYQFPTELHGQLYTREMTEPAELPTCLRCNITFNTPTCPRCAWEPQ